MGRTDLAFGRLRTDSRPSHHRLVSTALIVRNTSGANANRALQPSLLPHPEGFNEYLRRRLRCAPPRVDSGNSYSRQTRCLAVHFRRSQILRVPGGQRADSPTCARPCGSQPSLPLPLRGRGPVGPARAARSAGSPSYGAPPWQVRFGGEPHSRFIAGQTPRCARSASR
jgi:hypothetical protein